MQKYLLNSIKISVLSIDDLKLLFENYFLSGSTNEIITTFNLDFLRIAEHDLQFQEICKTSLLNLPDGFGIINLLKVKYKIKLERITGNDVFPILLSLAKKLNLKIAIVGGTNKVITQVKQKIIKEFEIENDKLFIISPQLEFEKNDSLNKEIINYVSEFKPDIVFAALGCPRQEKWLFANKDKLGSKLNIGIGATLDFYSGIKKRSPIFLQKIGLEWLWRLINEPIRLFKRYIIYDIPFYLKMIITKQF